MDNENEIVITPAERMYRNHLKNVGTYQRKNPNKMSEKCKRYNERIKADPDRYAEALKKRREYYHNVHKPRKEALKNSVEI